MTRTERKLETAKRQLLKIKAEKKEKSIKQLKKQLWKLVSEKVRLSSSYCYTCGKKLPYEQRNAGHFWPKGSHPATAFNLNNLRVQCRPCNHFKSGNLAKYSYRLLQELGQLQFIVLGSLAHSPHKWDKNKLLTRISELA